MPTAAETGHGSEALLEVTPEIAVDVVTIDDRPEGEIPDPEIDGVLFEEWAESPDPDEIPLAFGAWAGALTTYDVQFEA
jgi:hypothetical protein